MMKNLLIISIFFLFFLPSLAQQPQKTWELNQPENGTKRYVARKSISLRPGFQYTAKGSDSFTAVINPLVVIPETNTTYRNADGELGSIPELGGVVGEIQGQFALSPSGAATYSMPIEVPVGINGLKPDLALVYNSQGGFGLAGLNFDLAGLSEITRVPQNMYYDGKLSMVSFNGQDRFAVDGNRLLLVSGQYSKNGSKYGTEIYDNRRFLAQGINGDGPEMFLMSSGNYGLVMEYGGTVDSKVVLSDKKGVLSWKLNRVYDYYENDINYVYEAAPDGLSRVKRIAYAGNQALGVGYACTIEFEYYELNELKVNLLQMVVAGNKVKPGNFLKTIRISSNGNLFRKYEFKYYTDSYPRLKSVELFNGKGEQMPPTTFQWSQFLGEGQDFDVITGKSVVTGDFEGEGVSHLAEYDPNLNKLTIKKFYKHNESWSILNSAFFSESKGYPNEFFNIGDVDSDGIDDILLDQTYYISIPAREGGGYSIHSRIQILEGDRLSTIGSVEQASLFLRPVSGNFNGDGRLGVIFCDRDKGLYSVRIFINGGFQKLTFTDSFNLSDAKELYSGDFNGDGKTDILIRTASVLRFYSVAGNRLVLEKVLGKAGVENLLVGDFNGDGIDDLLLTQPERKFYYLKNFGEASFTESLTGFGDLDVGNSGNAIFGRLQSDFGYGAVTLKRNFESVSSFGTGSSENVADFAVFSYGHIEIVLTYTGKVPRLLPYRPGSVSVKYEAWSKTEFEKYVKNWKLVYSDIIGESEWGEPERFPDYLNVEEGLRYVIKVYPSRAVLTSFVRKYTGGWSKANVYFSAQAISSIKDVVTADFLGNGHNTTFVNYGNKLQALFNSKPHMKVSKINQGYFSSIDLDYDRLIHRNGVYHKNRGEQYPLLDYVGDMTVVKSINNGADISMDFEYEYGKLHLEGLGFLGFEKITSTDNVTKTRTVKVNKMAQNAPILLDEEWVVSNSESQARVRSTSYSRVLVPVSTTKRFFNRLLSVSEIDELSAIAIRKVFSNFDSNGNPKTISTYFGDDVFEEQRLQYVTAPAWGSPNLVSRVLVHRENKEESDGFIKRFLYHPCGKVYKEFFDGTSSGSSELITEYGIDHFGNINSEKVCNKGDCRSISRVYSPSARFIKTETNDQLEQTTTYSYNESLGTLSSVVSPFGRTEFEYDGFGRPTKTIYPDKTESVISRQWSGGDVSNAAYFVYNESSGSSPVKTWFDRANREILKEYYTFGETKAFVKTEYTDKGQVYRISQPFSGSIPNQWAVEFNYDEFGRILLDRRPGATRTFSYDGRVTRANSQTSKVETTINSAGEVVSSSTNGKSVAFSYYPMGQLKTASPEGGQVIFYRYDIYGNLCQSTDPGVGEMFSDYNGFGELLERRKSNPSGQGFTKEVYSYDPKTKLLKELNAGGQVTEYDYDELHRLKSVNLVGIHGQAFEYDNHSRPIRLTETISGKSFVFSTSYDIFGRPSKEIYPSGYLINKEYDELGFLTNVSDSKGSILWEATEMDVFGRLTKYKQGGRSTQVEYHEIFGLPKSIISNGIINMSYLYNSKGLLETRRDNVTKQEEIFNYNDVGYLSGGRLIRQGASPVDYGVHYNGTGSIEKKTHQGSLLSYKYDGPANAVSSIQNLPSSLIKHAPQTIDYNSFNKVTRIAEGDNTYSILYGADRQRVKSEVKKAGKGGLAKYYLPNYEEEHRPDGKVRKLHYISTSSGLSAIFVQNSGTDSLYYTYSDYQGNLLAVTDASGTIKEKYAYDAWGMRRNPENWSALDGRKSFLFSRGYTSHEHLDDFGLINMNGRVFDPFVSQFLSPDPFIQAPYNHLNYNRYGYCMNNPLMYSDPSGYNWFKDAWNWVWDKLNQFAGWADENGIPSGGFGAGMQGNSPYYKADFAGLTYDSRTRNQFDPAVNVIRSIDDTRMMESYTSATMAHWDRSVSNGISSIQLAANGGDGSGLPTIDGVTAPWSHEYITEKAFQILTDPHVGIAADLADWMRFTKGAGNTITLITVASDSYQRFYKQSIDNMTYGYRLTTTGLATWVGYSTGPIGGITVGLYSTGIEETARAGAKLEIQMRNYSNPTTKGSFWSKFYW